MTVRERKAREFLKKRPAIDVGWRTKQEVMAAGVRTALNVIAAQKRGETDQFWNSVFLYMQNRIFDAMEKANGGPL